MGKDRLPEVEEKEERVEQLEDERRVEQEGQGIF